ncbi:hypothetical protein, partial [Veillonella sp.]|uniref:hypothetical protein n=1 Tax=Veillonella sp. TaxID=1926307 RepID=UPI0025D9168C
ILNKLAYESQSILPHFYEVLLLLALTKTTLQQYTKVVFHYTFATIILNSAFPNTISVKLID